MYFEIELLPNVEKAPSYFYLRINLLYTSLRDKSNQAKSAVSILGSNSSIEFIFTEVYRFYTRVNVKKNIVAHKFGI